MGRRPATDQAHITVHHAEGADEVPVEECGPQLAPYAGVVQGHDRECPEGADQAIAFSKALSFETGALFGGFAGFRDLYVRVCRTHD